MPARKLVLTLALFCLWCSPQFGHPAKADDAALEAAEEQAFKHASALAAPSVVRIQTVGGLDRVGRVLLGTGPTTGVIVSPDGYIISSAFNFASKPASVLVQLGDGRRLPAKVVATDHLRMLTLIKIKAKDLTPAKAAPKTSFHVGQWALALGKTFDNAIPSMSVGIVSALNRVWGKAIQTDAKVSPVNYGGPLVDVEGRVLGILVPLSSRRRGETAGVEWYDSGIGFAIPLADVYAALDRLKAGKDLMPGRMGIEFKPRSPLDAKPAIERVRAESPAEKSGLKSGDVILAVNGTKVGRQAEVRQALGTHYAGDKIRIVVRRGQKTIPVSLVLIDKLRPYESAYLGVLPRRAANNATAQTGVVIRYVFADSPAAKSNLKIGDRIVRLGSQNIADAASLLEQISALKPGSKVSLVITRDGRKQPAVEVTLASIPNTVPGELRTSLIPPVKKTADDSDSDDDKNDDAATKKDDSESTVEEPKTGRFTVSMPQHEHSYWTYVPESYNPNYNYGLMVWIHPGGDTMEASLYRQWKSICERRGLILVAPKAKKIAGWTLNEAEFVHDAVEQVQGRYSIDPNRIFLHSYSQGGRFAYHLAFKYRDLFRGIAVAGAALRQRPPENSRLNRLQFYLTCGTKDPSYKLVGRTASGLRRLKYPAVFTPVTEAGQKYPPAKILREIGRWADCLDRI